MALVIYMNSKHFRIKKVNEFYTNQVNNLKTTQLLQDSIVNLPLSR